LDQSQPWGKLDKLSGDSHHLAHHCAEVAASFLGLVRQPVIRSRLECAAGRMLSEVDLDRLGMLVFLHDVGKLFPGFQAKGWPDDAWSGPKNGHLQEGHDIFFALDDGPAAALCVEALEAWGVDESVLRVVLAHHGRPLPNDNSDRRGIARAQWYDPNAAAIKIGSLLPQWFELAFSVDPNTMPNSASFEHFLAGLTALADWIGSAVDRFPFVADLDEHYMALAKERAAAALTAFGLDPSCQRATRLADATFREISGRTSPNAQQRLVGSTDLEAALVILEAETGSGKTEAALWRYAQLFEAGRIDGLYFAVPTRAAAVQLHRRICEASKRLFGGADPQPILAVPGYFRAGSSEGTPLPDWKVRWDDARDADERILSARWAAEHSKRYLAAQIAVGTVDQAMLGALMVKHAHLRATSLSRSLLVIDEVHASDRFMTAIQRRLLDAHLSVGGYAMLMSATLGSTARSAWLKQPSPSFDAAVATPYPAVWTDRGVAPRTPDEPPLRAKSVVIDTLATMAAEATAAAALAAARKGARVLIIRNTVARAVETLQALEAICTPEDEGLLFRVNGITTLHHSRFAPNDRRQLDLAAEAALKPDPSRSTGGRVIIGTQTLEQSLDICADILLTDLCPVDVLLQRIGRLHRHDLPRPVGFEQPRCVVMLPEQGLEALLKPAFENGLGAWRSQDGTLGGIYRDVSILELTHRVITRYPAWEIPKMNRLLVESATHDAAIQRLHDELGSAWRTYHDEVFAGKLAMETFAHLQALDRRKRFDELAFPNDEERIRTRLGEEGARIVFAEPLPMGPFGQLVESIVLPAHWSHGVSGDEAPAIMTSSEGSFTFAVGGARFTYDRFGVQRARATNEPADGATDPL
jgi:CRISPR-associated endonuclease/helicase Cas3